MAAWPTSAVAAVALATTLALATPARAQSAAELQRAKDSFQAGAAAYAAGDYLAAIQALDAAYALTPVPAIAFSLAQAERRQYFVARERTHLHRAVTLYRRYLEQVPAGGRRADALDALSQLEPLVALQGTGEPGAAAVSSAATTAPRPTRLMITAEAPGAKLAIDDQPPAASPVIREVSAGKHRVTVSAPGFFPEERQVTAEAGELIPVMIALREKPSILSISAPAEAELYLNGVFLRRGGSGLQLNLPSGPHRLSVAEKGHQVVSRALDLSPGQTEQVTVTLPVTAQRRAARLLFVAGGVFLGSGAVFGGLALRAQDQAQQFLDRQARGNVSSEDLDDYSEHVTRRNRYRMAAGASLALTAGALVTGLLLHEFDRASPEDLQRAEAAAGIQPGNGVPRPAPGRGSQLQVIPLVSASLGLGLDGRF